MSRGRLLRIVALALVTLLLFPLNTVAFAQELDPQTGSIPNSKVYTFIKQSETSIPIVVHVEEISSTVTPHSNDEYFVVSRTYRANMNFGYDGGYSAYDVYASGTVSKVSSNRYITSVVPTHVGGMVLPCDIEYNGAAATITFNHPQNGGYPFYFTLGPGGTFDFY